MNTTSELKTEMEKVFCQKQIIISIQPDAACVILKGLVSASMIGCIPNELIELSAVKVVTESIIDPSSIDAKLGDVQLAFLPEFKAICQQLHTLLKPYAFEKP